MSPLLPTPLQTDDREGGMVTDNVGPPIDVEGQSGGRCLSVKDGG